MTDTPFPLRVFSPTCCPAVRPHGVIRTISTCRVFHAHLTRLAILILVASLLGLTSCASTSRGPTPPPSTATTSRSLLSATRNGGFWWGCRFKISWPAGEDPDFTVDLLLAHAVVGPVLKEFENRLGYWRFHRRAAPDKTGHQFSFLFYSDPATAAEVFARIEQSAPLSEALAAGIVGTLSMDDPARPSRPGVEDTSDRIWSPSLQRRWPAFIMGVSSLWLGLIDETMGDAATDSRDIQALLGRYREANGRVTAIWHKEGQHAFLHHLNAIFGYEPLLLRKEMSF